MVCHDCVIDDVCKRVHSIESEAQLSQINRKLRPQYFKVIPIYRHVIKTISNSVVLK